jgi:hypothetical protein
MTTASAGASAGGHGRLFRLAIFLGHYTGRYYTPILIIIWGVIVLGWWVPATTTGTLYAVVWAVTVTVLAAELTGLLCQFLVHDRNLCPREIEESPLLDPQAAVTKNLRTLQAFHDRRRQIILGLFAMSPVIVLLMLAGNRDMPAPIKAAFTAVAVLGIALAAWVSRIQQIHQRLHLWCPWCRRDDGPDDPAVTPTPDPVGTVQG